LSVLGKHSISKRAAIACVAKAFRTYWNRQSSADSNAKLCFLPLFSRNFDQNFTNKCDTHVLTPRYCTKQATGTNLVVEHLCACNHITKNMH